MVDGGHLHSGYEARCACRGCYLLGVTCAAINVSLPVESATCGPQTLEDGGSPRAKEQNKSFECRAAHPYGCRALHHFLWAGAAVGMSQAARATLRGVATTARARAPAGHPVPDPIPPPPGTSKFSGAHVVGREAGDCIPVHGVGSGGSEGSFPVRGGYGKK